MATAIETDQVPKAVEGIYKNILENFNPASRQMINTGKAYLKTLHGASAASSLYLDSLVRVSRQAHQDSAGGSTDIGECLTQITEVFKEIHTLQLNTLKAFYVDFLVPLETNLEQDTRVIQSEQKKFLTCHKRRVEAYGKAAANVKKLKKRPKKFNASTATLDKEIKVMRIMEEEKEKLDAFFDKSLQEALLHQRRRYGFILERKASLAKHYANFFQNGSSHLKAKLEKWQSVAKTRDVLPETTSTTFKSVQEDEMSDDDCEFCNQKKKESSQEGTMSSQLKKAKSLEAGEMLAQSNASVETKLLRQVETIRAKSEADLAVATSSSPINRKVSPQFPGQPQSLQPETPEGTNQDGDFTFARAIYSYTPSGDSQLGFRDGDIISLIGEKTKGWQFGENLRTQKVGWFPIAYTSECVPPHLNGAHRNPAGSESTPNSVPNFSNRTVTEDPGEFAIYAPPSNSSCCSTPAFHKGDHLVPYNSTLPMKPLDVPSEMNTPRTSQIVSNKTITRCHIKYSSTGGVKPVASASDSIHSSDDSGFSNDAQRRFAALQPEVDYSDNDSTLLRSATKPSDFYPSPAKEEPTSTAPSEAWLMERYHKSESIRIGGLGIGGIGVKRKSHSFSNVSRGPAFVSDKMFLQNSLEHALSHETLIPGAEQRQAALQRRPTGTLKADKSEGKIKKFLHRTKSLIWRRSASDQLDSISYVGSSSSLELWRSHASLIDTNCEDVRAINYDTSRVESGSKNAKAASQVSIKNDTIRTGEQQVRRSSSTPPPLPPFPPALAAKVEKRKSQVQLDNKATSTTSSLQNLAYSTTGDLEHGKDTESCIVIRDHAKHKGSQRSSRNYRTASGYEHESSHRPRNESRSTTKASERLFNEELHPSYADVEEPIVPVSNQIHPVNSEVPSDATRNGMRRNSATKHSTKSGSFERQRRPVESINSEAVNYQQGRPGKEYAVDEEVLEFDDEDTVTIYEDNDSDSASGFSDQGPELQTSSLTTKSFLPRTNTRQIVDERHENRNGTSYSSYSSQKKHRNASSSDPQSAGFGSQLHDRRNNSHPTKSLVRADLENSDCFTREDLAASCRHQWNSEDSKHFAAKPSTCRHRDHSNHGTLQPSMKVGRTDSAILSTEDSMAQYHRNSRSHTTSRSKSSTNQRESFHMQHRPLPQLKSNQRPKGSRAEVNTQNTNKSGRSSYKSKQSGNIYGPWNDLWGEDPPIPCK